MCQCDDRLDALSVQFIKHLIIKPKSRFIGIFIIRIRKNPCPADTHSKCLKSTLLHPSYVFFISVIEIHRLMLWIILLLLFCLHICNTLLQKLSGIIGIAAACSFFITNLDIRNIQPFSILQIGSLHLNSSTCATP